jgi:4-carboxymuconolactone decarboxylase
MTDLQELRYLPVADWDTSLASVVEDMHGRPLNVHGLMAHHPALLLAWWKLRNHVISGGALGPKLGEMVILRAAHHLKNDYEWSSHVLRAADAGLTNEEIKRIADAALTDSHWLQKEFQILVLVDELFEMRAISPATLASLDDNFTAQELMDLMAIQGFYSILGAMLNTWPTPLDQHLADALADRTSG